MRCFLSEAKLKLETRHLILIIQVCNQRCKLKNYIFTYFRVLNVGPFVSCYYMVLKMKTFNKNRSLCRNSVNVVYKCSY